MRLQQTCWVALVALMALVSALCISAQSVTQLQDGERASTGNIPARTFKYFRYYVNDTFFSEYCREENPSLNILVEVCKGQAEVYLNLGSRLPDRERRPSVLLSDSNSYQLSIPLRFREHMIGIYARSDALVQIVLSLNLTDSSLPQISNGTLQLTPIDDSQVLLNWSSGENPTNPNNTDSVACEGCSVYRAYYVPEKAWRDTQFNLDTNCGWENFGLNKGTFIESNSTSVLVQGLDPDVNYIMTFAALSNQGLARLTSTVAKSAARDQVGEPLVSDRSAIIIVIVFLAVILLLVVGVLVFRNHEIRKIEARKQQQQGSRPQGARH